MRRNEACELLSRIAQNELVDKELSKFLLKARDVVICDHNKILDVSVSSSAKEDVKKGLKHFLFETSENVKLIDHSIARDLRLLWIDLQTNPESQIPYYEKCDEMYLPTRCKNCPNYNGCVEKE